MIVNFADKDTESIARGYRVKQFDSFARIAQRKLRQLEIAGSIQDLRIPPGNRLEKLAGNRDGQWSLRINDQFRICFRWTAAGPADVEIVNYH
ncbi:type II toxin-antitoxin system RelE/ParE family toxin [uncultured Adlercreutzia sp.]|uniref:type II toxin-antitoxin system RelE/ParE family toxin n=1 Tax=uncultured Adlercreutzia sp. TaxID=875803 RepID=UPI002665373C|nr:type II toxin-antitoxin system RelE/ParE family toxin [uncultured Adlercreutzia sp.]